MKIINLLICLIFIFSLLGCQNNINTTKANNKASAESITESLTKPVPDLTNDLTSDLTSEKPIQETTIKEVENNMSTLATDFVKNIKIGWNLGNTLDSLGGNSSDISSVETSWGNPIATKALIQSIKDAGFNTIRIPVSWGNHLGEAPEYKINSSWLDRVNDVVDFAIDLDMYVILNTHHEEWLFTSYNNEDLAKKILKNIWTQIAERFKNYNTFLIFESMNEPRMFNTSYEWNGGNKEGHDVVNELNKTFIDTIRQSDSKNNKNRFLMIPPYAATSNKKAWANFIIPNDERLIVSIHAYSPYNFALNKDGTSSFTNDSSLKKEINDLMNDIDLYFLSKNVPVIIGEFGATNKSNINERIEWAKYYLSKAKEKNIPCIIWDNGAFFGDGQKFGLINRKTLQWEYPLLLEALTDTY